MDRSRKERPILFNAEMVRAILDGRKTQTRRPVKPQPPETAVEVIHASGKSVDGNDWKFIARPLPSVQHAVTGWIKCPFGLPGDRLWVRETWSTSANGWIYKADGIDLSDALSLRWKPSIHMPRWASRITLEVVSVRVERVQGISEGDIIKEGCPDEYLLGRNWLKPAWDNIYGNTFSWESNPWVWVVEFERVK